MLQWNISLVESHNLNNTNNKLTCNEGKGRMPGEGIKGTKGIHVNRNLRKSHWEGTFWDFRDEK